MNIYRVVRYSYGEHQGFSFFTSEEEAEAFCLTANDLEDFHVLGTEPLPQTPDELLALLRLWADFPEAM